MLNAVTVIFIVATMFAAGLGATVPALLGVFTNVPLLVLALIANMVVIPLIGWGLGALLGLPSAAFIALILVASSPGGPFGGETGHGPEGRRRRGRSDAGTARLRRQPHLRTDCQCHPHRR
ncbi:hypothetical protein LT493_37625 [Streptomyces tricolor]|nr:hypothetical protein [Streptomyces tricolor]